MTTYNTYFTILFDSDEELYYTKVGIVNEGITSPKTGSLPLHYTIWGRSAKECKQRAAQLVTMLHNQQTIHGTTIH